MRMKKQYAFRDKKTGQFVVDAPIEPVRIYHLIMKNTMDEEVLKALSEKDTTQERLLAALKARIEKGLQ